MKSPRLRKAPTQPARRTSNHKITYDDECSPRRAAGDRLDEYRHMNRWLKSKISGAVLRPEIVYRLYLKYRHGAGRPRGTPNAPWQNAVLKSRREWEDALGQVRSLRLPPHIDEVKNWDHLAALDCVLKNTDRSAHVLDAGAELYSPLLPWLFLYGYGRLTGINLTFRLPVNRGPIRYEYGDITGTKFEANAFDAIACLSVIEHGVDLHAYFEETSRILKPGGLLITSTDYCDNPIDTLNKEMYGKSAHIFSRGEIAAALDAANRFGLEPTDRIDLDCKEMTINRDGLDYTFLIFTLRKIANIERPSSNYL